MGDGQGLVAVTTRVSGRAPDGRAFDDAQIVLFTLDGEQLRGVDQYMATAAFWA